MGKPIYVSVFKKFSKSSDSNNTRVTSYVLGVHGNTIKELKAKAKAEYPNDWAFVMSTEDYHKTLSKYYTSSNYMFSDGVTITNPDSYSDNTSFEEVNGAEVEINYGIIPHTINAEEVKKAARNTFFNNNELIFPNGTKIGVEQ